MKKNKIPLLLVLFAPILLILLSLSLHAQDTCFTRTIGGKSTDVGRSIVALPDKTLILAGNTGSSSFGGGDILLIKIDSLGNKLWSKVYGSPQTENITEIIYAPDNFIYGCGYTNSVSGNQWDVFIIKWDTTGTLQWIKTFGSSSWDFAYAITVTPDTSFVIAGTTYQNPYGTRNILVISLDTAGQLLWQKTYGYATADDYATDLVVDTSQRIILIANSDSTPSQQFNPYLFVLNAQNGDSITAFFLPSDSACYASAIVFNLSQSYFAVGYESTKQTPFQRIYVQRFNYDLSPQSEYWAGITNIPVHLTYFLIDSNNRQVLVGYADNFGFGQNEALYYVFDSYNNFVTSGAGGGTKNDRFFSATFLPSLGYYLLGYTETPSTGLEDFYLMKTYANGSFNNCTGMLIADTLYNDQTSILSIKETSLLDSSPKLYPNPAHEYIILHAPHPPYQVGIYHLTGQQVLSLSMTDNTLLIPLAALEKGLYLLRLLSPSEAHSYKIMKY